MKKAFSISALTALLLISCGKLERDNPLDNNNPESNTFAEAFLFDSFNIVDESVADHQVTIGETLQIMIYVKKVGPSGPGHAEVYNNNPMAAVVENSVGTISEAGVCNFGGPGGAMTVRIASWADPGEAIDLYVRVYDSRGYCDYNTQGHIQLLVGETW